MSSDRNYTSRFYFMDEVHRKLPTFLLVYISVNNLFLESDLCSCLISLNFFLLRFSFLCFYASISNPIFYKWRSRVAEYDFFFIIKIKIYQLLNLKFDNFNSTSMKNIVSNDPSILNFQNPNFIIKWTLKRLKQLSKKYYESWISKVCFI